MSNYSGFPMLNVVRLLQELMPKHLRRMIVLKMMKQKQEERRKRKRKLRGGETLNAYNVSRKKTIGVQRRLRPQSRRKRSARRRNQLQLLRPNVKEEKRLQLLVQLHLQLCRYLLNFLTALILITES